ncbi:HP0268 family nuclease, partial [Helicobacter typhlonius]
FDKENSHKDMQKACAFFQKAGHSTHLHEVRYGIDEESYIYELHII